MEKEMQHFLSIWGIKSVKKKNQSVLGPTPRTQLWEYFLIGDILQSDMHLRQSGDLLWISTASALIYSLASVTDGAHITTDECVIC